MRSNNILFVSKSVNFSDWCISLIEDLSIHFHVCIYLLSILNVTTQFTLLETSRSNHCDAFIELLFYVNSNIAVSVRLINWGYYLPLRKIYNVILSHYITNMDGLWQMILFFIHVSFSQVFFFRCELFSSILHKVLINEASTMNIIYMGIISTTSLEDINLTPG